MLYNIIRQNFALAAGIPFLTIVPANRSLLIVEMDVEGAGIASAYNEFNLYKVLAAGVGGPTANTLIAQPVESPNMTGTTPALALAAAVNTVYATTQPTFIATAILQNVPVNSNGQRYYWRANANLSDAIRVPGNALGVLLAGLNGTGNISCRVKVEEI